MREIGILERVGVLAGLVGSIKMFPDYIGRRRKVCGGGPLNLDDC